jgi:ABC-type multidrug transport system fused ATPase/permease subunit
MEDNFSNYFNQTGKVAKEYLETRLDLIKLQAAGKLSKALGLFFSLILAFLLFFFVIVFLGMVLGFWIGEMTNSFTLGFSCSAGLFVILLGIILAFRKPLVQIPLSNMLVRELLSEMDVEEKEEESKEKEFNAEKKSADEEEEELYEQL